MPKSVPNCIQTCFEHVLGKIFRKIFAQFSMECRVFGNFRKIFFSKFQKCPKVFPKVSKRVLGRFFRKNFMPNVPWRVESSKIFKKIKKISKFQKCPKSFPKVSKHVLNMFWGKPLGKVLPSFPWNVESSKIFKKKIFKITKIPKMPKSVPRSIQTCFRVIFPNNVYAQCSMVARNFEKFQKNQEIFKIPKRPKIVAKSIQTCFEHVLGKIFWKLLAQFSMECRVFGNFSNFFFSKFQKCPKVFPKVSKRVLG